MKNEVVHELKAWPEYFEEIWQGRKTFDIRKNDRAFRVGDVLFLREYFPNTNQYSGRELKAQINYLLSDYIGLTDGYVAMSIAVFDDMPF